MDSGAEQLVFVAHEGGYFEPRKVRLGAKWMTNSSCSAGWKAGERVVTSANFPIDSESKLKSAANGMGMLAMSHGGDHGGKAKLPRANHHCPPIGGPFTRIITPTTPQTKIEDHSRHQPKKQE